ncbi:hypothetical protein PBY51_015152 [Eleginops maclovinus]|uniref:Uncharacterized protein n=1 Tax=Eleginops maclovinus TaxID=56733 RepID=A0AAN8AG81_ELEMC|nr:hypothetical protein PBY51_015152 [Eleginops maclovinus]
MTQLSLNPPLHETNTQNDRLRGPAYSKKNQRSVWVSLDFIPGDTFSPPASDGTTRCNNALLNEQRNEIQHH